MTRPDTIVFPIGDAGEVHLSCSTRQLTAVYSGSPEHTVYIALGYGSEPGSCIVPYAQGFDGSTVFLPFSAHHLYCVSGERRWNRAWHPMAWGDCSADCPELAATVNSVGQTEISVSWSERTSSYSVAIYVKDLRENNGWGTLLGCCDAGTTPGFGDKALETFVEASPLNNGEWEVKPAYRFHAQSRELIYELFVRLFGNANPRRKRNGTLAENGCGKFADISSVAIARIAEMGFTHVWLMGVVRHATTTSYDLPGLGADDTDLMKGLAGSPYAVKDFFDVAPDLARDPSRRMDEFRELVGRIHAADLKVLVDFVGNHVSRAYESQVKPDLNFGNDDDSSKFFAPDNNFYYLGFNDHGDGPPLRLPTYDREAGVAISPTCAVKQDCNGLFAGETNTGRVTGNNSITWSPSINDWYETVKLNYGFEFSGRFTPQRCFPHAQNVDASVPATWLKMDAVLAHWQQLGVNGFRCDMAHMIPPEFWSWSIARARQRDRAVFFMAEAYNDYFAVRSSAPEVVALGNEPLFEGLLHGGFNAVYGHDVYRVIKDIYDGDKWANDIDKAVGSDYVFSHSVHYAENHDEIRLASPFAWNANGPDIGRAASAVLSGISRGPVLLYSGQETGEPASEAEGFSGADGRTTLFDYWSMPEFSKWVNNGAFDGGLLTQQQKDLRAYYARLVRVCGHNVFRNGNFMSLNPPNLDNPHYGRLEGETASGHWIYSFLRYDRSSKQRLLAIANFHNSERFTNLRIRLPESVPAFFELPARTALRLTEMLGEQPLSIDLESLSSEVLIASLPAFTAYYFTIEESAFTRT